MKLDRKLVPSVVLNALTGIAMLVWIVPTIGLLVSSVFPGCDGLSTGWWTALNSPLKITKSLLENYTETVAPGLRISFLIASVVTLLLMVIATFAAFWLAHTDSGEAKMVSCAVLVFLVLVPLLMTLLPVVPLQFHLSLSWTFFGLWLVHVAYGLPFAVFMLNSLFKVLPKDVLESAHIDGASPVTAFFFIALPLAVPPIASLIVFQSLWIWSDALVAVVYLNGVPVAVPATASSLSGLIGACGLGWHFLLSGILISIVVPLLVFRSFHKRFVRGVLVGLLKNLT